MIGLKDFFKKIQNRHTTELFVRSVIQSSVKKHTGVEVSLDSISFSSSSVVLKDLSSGLKSAIFIKKNAILSDINSGQGNKVVTDIR